MADTISPEVKAAQVAYEARPFAVYLRTSHASGHFRFDTERQALDYLFAQFGYARKSFLSNSFGSAWFDFDAHATQVEYPDGRAIPARFFLFADSVRFADKPAQAVADQAEAVAAKFHAQVERAFGAKLEADDATAVGELLAFGLNVRECAAALKLGFVLEHLGGGLMGLKKDLGDYYALATEDDERFLAGVYRSSDAQEMIEPSEHATFGGAIREASRKLDLLATPKPPIVAVGEVTNEQRADWALAALEAFPPIDSGDEDAIPDLICDLLHLARRRGLDINGLLNNAMMHFEAERFEDATCEHELNQHDDCEKCGENFSTYLALKARGLL